MNFSGKNCEFEVAQIRENWHLDKVQEAVRATKQPISHKFSQSNGGQIYYQDHLKGKLSIDGYKHFCDNRYREVKLQSKV